MNRILYHVLFVLFLIFNIINVQLSYSDTINTDEYIIADTKGDWGYPSPFLHYLRGPGYVRMSLIFDTLVWKDQKGVTPLIAEKWSYDSKKNIYYFKIKDNIKWHDGNILTAEDAAFSYNYLKKFNYRWVDLKYIKSAKSKGKNIVEIEMAESYVPFISEIASTVPIIPKKIWEKINNPLYYNQPEIFIGSGPFRYIAFYPAKQYYQFERFNEYHLGTPKIKTLKFIKVQNQVAALMNGEADFAQIKPEMKEILSKKGYEVIESDYGWLKSLYLNHRTEPFKNKEFRKAIAMLIDKKELIAKSQNGNALEGSSGFLPKTNRYYNDKLQHITYSPAEAEKILAKIGYKKNTNGFFSKNGEALEIDLLVSSISAGGEKYFDRDPEIIKNKLEKSGIKVKIRNTDQSVTDYLIKNWNFHAAISGHGGMDSEPKFLNELFEDDSKGINIGYRYTENNLLNNLLLSQIQESDSQKRLSIIHQIQQILSDDVPSIPLYYLKTYAAFNKSKVNWFYTYEGISVGIPIALNKLAVVR